MKGILLIEDDKIIALDMKETLKSNGYEVDNAIDGVEGLEKIKQKTYDLIITDIKMSLMDGEEFYTKVLALNRDLAKRIIFISGNLTDFIKSTGNPFLEKPFTPEQVVETVNKLTT